MFQRRKPDLDFVQEQSKFKADKTDEINKTWDEMQLTVDNKSKPNGNGKPC